MDVDTELYKQEGNVSVTLSGKEAAIYIALRQELAYLAGLAKVTAFRVHKAAERVHKLVALTNHQS